VRNPGDQLAELIDRQDAEIAGAEQQLATLTEQVAAVRRLLGDLRRERSVLEAVARRAGDPAAIGGATPGPVPAWTSLTRVQAVEQTLLRSRGALHLREIESLLRSNGRTYDDVALISATLAYLKRQRGTVRCVGRGRWEANVDTSRTARGVEAIDEVRFEQHSVVEDAVPNVARPPRSVPSLADA
jgi:hypothetical protein